MKRRCCQPSSRALHIHFEQSSVASSTPDHCIYYSWDVTTPFTRFILFPTSSTDFQPSRYRCLADACCWARISLVTPSGSKYTSENICPRSRRVQ